MALEIFKSKNDMVPIILYTLSIVLSLFFLVTLLLGLRF